jgi:hypothetical protein
MHEQQAPRPERGGGALRQDNDVSLPDCAPDIGHEDNVVSSRPIGGDRVAREMRDPIGEPRLAHISLGGIDGLGKSRIVAESCGLAAQNAML